MRFLGVIGMTVLVGSFAWADESFVSKRLYREVSALAAEVLRACPPSDCVVVGLGRSPTPVIAQLQNDHMGYAYTVPLTRFNYHPTRRRLSEAQEARLETLFDATLPASLGRGGEAPKKVLVIDYGDTGASIFSFKAYLERYLGRKGHGALPVQAAPIFAGEQSLRNLKKTAGIYGVKDFYALSIEEGSALGSEMHFRFGFKRCAEFSQYDIQDVNARIERRTEYLALRSELRQWSDKKAAGGCYGSMLRLLGLSRP